MARPTPQHAPINFNIQTIFQPSLSFGGKTYLYVTVTMKINDIKRRRNATIIYLLHVHVYNHV